MTISTFIIWQGCDSSSRMTLVGTAFNLEMKIYLQVLTTDVLHKTSSLAISRWSGDVIRRTGEKNFNAVSHNRARPYFLFQHGRGEVISWRFPLECSFSNRKCGRHVMICWVLAMAILQGVWKQHLRPRAVVGYGVKIFLPSPPNYVTRSPGSRWLFCRRRQRNGQKWKTHVQVVQSSFVFFAH